MQPVVSLLVPIYNVEKYLRECLDSAKSQTLSDIEIICINDGSTDSSPDIIREYMQADSRFKIIDKANSGYGASMNQGLDAACGKYIGILESDDFFEPDALEKLVNAAEAAEAQVAKANFWFYWSTPEEKNELFELVTAPMTGHVVNPHKETEIFYLKPSIWSAVYRKDFLEQNGIRFLETPGASFQDSSFNFKVWAMADRVVFLQDAILHYRQDNESSSVNSPAKVYCICDEHAEIDSFLSSHKELASLREVEEGIKFDNYMWNYERLTEPLQREFIQRFASEFSSDKSKGYLNEAVLGEWRAGELAALIADPTYYHARRAAQQISGGKFAKAKCYFTVGGFASLAKAISRKVG